MTQSTLGEALGQGRRIAIATVSSWESDTSPKIPSEDRLRDYALFFCTPRSRVPNPHLLGEDELTAAERTRYDEIREELFFLREQARSHNGTKREPDGHFWVFDEDPVTIVCPELPDGVRSELANPKDPNYTRIFRYGDVDALIDLYAHIKFRNPNLRVKYLLPPDVDVGELSGNLVLLGGVGWNRTVKRLYRLLDSLPVTQEEVTDLETGEIFRLKAAPDNEYRPQWNDPASNEDLAEDVGLLARVPNPYNADRTVTLCNGVHSRGVVAAAQCLTDETIRVANESYLRRRFPSGTFAILFRVKVDEDKTSCRGSPIRMSSCSSGHQQMNHIRHESPIPPCVASRPVSHPALCRIPP